MRTIFVLHTSAQIMLGGKENRALFLLQRGSVRATVSLLAKPSPWFLGGNPSRAVVFKVWFLKQNLVHMQILEPTPDFLNQRLWSRTLKPEF